MPDRLDFNDGQVTQIKALFDEQQTNPQLTRTQMSKHIAAVLTDEQRANIEDRKRSDCNR